MSEVAARRPNIVPTNMIPHLLEGNVTRILTPGARPKRNENLRFGCLSAPMPFDQQAACLARSRARPIRREA